MPKFLVTGGAGFIGSHMVDYLSKERENKVLVVDNFSTGKTENLWFAEHRDNITVRDVNVNEYEFLELMSVEQVDYIFHYAAMVGVKRTLNFPTYVLADIDGIRNVVKVGIDKKVKRLFYSSSSEVYGEPVESPQHEETTPLNARLPYAQVKLIGETFLKAYHKKEGLNFTAFRFFNTYGLNQSNNFVVSKFIDQALKGENLTVYGDGKQTRTFCYIEENIAAQIACLEKNLCMNEIVNIGSGKEVSMNDLADAIIGLCGFKSKIVHVDPLEEGDMTRRCADNTKMREQLVSTPLMSIEDGLREIISKKKEQESQ